MPRVDGSQTALWNRVSPGYFKTIGQRIVEGRDFTDGDSSTTRGVAIVNQAFVRRYFPGEDAIGKVFGFANPANSTSLQIIAVVQDAKYADPDQPAGPMVFGTLAQRIHYADPAMQEEEKWSHFITGAQVWTAGDAADGGSDPRGVQAGRPEFCDHKYSAYAAAGGGQLRPTTPSGAIERIVRWPGIAARVL